MPKTKNPADYLPLTETTYCILLSLTQPLHGYGIMQNVQEMSKGKVQIGPGTLYGALDKLASEGLIVRADNGTSRRKSYVLTEQGRKVIRLEYNRLVELSKYAEKAMREWRE